MYVSHSLAMLAIAVHPGSRTTRLIRESGEFSVSFFASRSRRWPARQGSRRQVSMNSQRNIPVQGPPGDLTPRVAGSVAVLWGRVSASEPTGDHLLYVGEVVAHHQEGPLLRYRRRYMRSGSWPSEESPEGYPTQRLVRMAAMPTGTAATARQGDA